MVDWLNELQAKDIITFIGIILTTIISFVTLVFTIKNNKAVHYVNAITKSRVEWIQNVRESISEYFAAIDVMYLSCEKNDFSENVKTMESLTHLKNKLVLYLNYTDDKDKQIIEYLSDINKNAFIYYRLKYFLMEYTLNENKDKRKILEMIENHPVTIEVLDEFLSPFFDENRAVDLFEDLPLSLKDFSNKKIFVITAMSIISSKDNSLFYSCIEYMFKADEKYKSIIADLTQKIIIKIQIILKFEWNRVKIEAKGKKYRKFKQKRDMKKLEQEYYNVPE